MVYQKFLDLQLDYIYLIYGLAFVLLAHACFYAGRRKDTKLPWTLLGIFAGLHSLHEFLDLTALALGDDAYLAVVRYVALTGSFVFLLEFGRKASTGTGGGRVSRYALPLLLAASFIIGARSGIEGLNASARYAVGLTGGLWAAIALFGAARESGVPGRRLVHAGVGMLLYALATGLVVKHAAFFPATAVNYASFNNAVGVPVQLVKLVLIIIVVVSLVFYFSESECDETEGKSFNKPQCSFRPILMLLVILAAGWFLTNTVGRHVEEEARVNLTSRTLTAAAGINPYHVIMLTGTPADDGKPEFEEIRERLQKIKEVNPDCRYVYLMGLKGGKEIFLVDAEPKGSKDYSSPGDVYPDATPEDIAEFPKGMTKIYEPYTDSWGTWVSGVSFIRNPAPGKVAAMLGMDIAASVWLHTVSMTRYFCIAIIFFVSMLTVVVYDAWERNREAVEQSVALRIAEQKLKGEKRLRDLVNSLGEGVILHDADGVISFANPEAERLLGRGKGELSGKQLADAVGCGIFEHDGKLTDSITAIPLGEGRMIRVENAQFTRRDGSQIEVSFVASPIIEGDSVAGAVIAFQDITERKNIERQKSDFYAMVTHDLKSPLVTIQGYSDLLLDENKDRLDQDSTTMLENIRESGKKMLRMVNDFLTVSRLEFGSIALNEELEDINGLVDGAVSELKPLASKKNISIVSRPAEGHVRAVCDRSHLLRALCNLVQNAINYTGKGGEVTVAVGEAVLEGREHVMISVSDTGPGIPPEERDKIFNMYYRSPKTAGLKGSGLGLAIVKAVATAHGGKIELESEEGRGSTFMLYLPKKR